MTAISTDPVAYEVPDDDVTHQHRKTSEHTSHATIFLTDHIGKEDGAINFLPPTQQYPSTSFSVDNGQLADADPEKSTSVLMNQRSSTKPNSKVTFPSLSSETSMNSSFHHWNELPTRKKSLKRKRRALSHYPYPSTFSTQQNLFGIPTDLREDVKAAARAYALSSNTTKSKAVKTNHALNNVTSESTRIYQEPLRLSRTNQQAASTEIGSSSRQAQPQFKPLTIPLPGAVPIYDSKAPRSQGTKPRRARSHSETHNEGATNIHKQFNNQPPPPVPPFVPLNGHAASYGNHSPYHGAWKTYSNPSTDNPPATYPQLHEVATPAIKSKAASKSHNYTESCSKNQKQNLNPSPQTSIELDEIDDNLDEYELFVKFLGLENIDEGLITTKMKDDDDDEFVLDAVDDDDDEDFEEDADIETESTFLRSSIKNKGKTETDEHSVDESDWGADFSRELAEELGWLEEEDMEAAVATLLDQPYSTKKHGAVSVAKESSSNSPSSHTSSTAIVTPLTPASKPSSEAPGSAFPTKDCTSSGNRSFIGSLSTSFSPEGSSDTRQISECNQHRPHPMNFSSSNVESRFGVSTASKTVAVTAQQYEQLQQLLEKHYQLLIQQAVLAVRAANSQKMKRSAQSSSITMTASSGSNDISSPLSAQVRTEFITGGETAEDLVEILDGAVGMLQDLDQNRKDAIRYFVQFSGGAKSTAYDTTLSSISTRNSNRSLFPIHVRNASIRNKDEPTERRLTRAQFTKTLLEQTNGQFRTVFDIKGLSQLKDTFNLIDKSVEEVRLMNRNNCNILELSANYKACHHVLEQAGAKIDNDLVPGSRDVSLNFVDAREFLGESFQPPCTTDQEITLKRNRNLFTSGEDNLVFRGVNLYGEKQWAFIADRFLPDRSVHIIAQRYSKLCFMLYKAHGVQIDNNGNLATPPKLESLDDLDENKVSKLRKVEPPALLNVHRWSLEEDLTLLKAVPIMGFMWAELKARLMPHRDRGHLRKRYQVLERRVRATFARLMKHEACASKDSEAKASGLSSPKESSPAVIAKSTSSSRSFKAVSVENKDRKKANNSKQSKQPIALPTSEPQCSKGRNSKRSSRKVDSESEAVTRVVQNLTPEKVLTGEDSIKPQTWLKKRPRVPSIKPLPTASSYGPNQPPAPHQYRAPCLSPSPSPASSQHHSPSQKPSPPPLNFHPPPPPHHMIPYPHPYVQPPSQLNPGYHIHPYVYHHPYHTVPTHYPPLHHPHPPQLRQHPPNSDETSRFGYEKLVHEPNQEWSRMSELDKAIEEEEVAAASTIVSQLAKSPKKVMKTECEEKEEATRDSFVNKNFEDATSGLTVLEGFQTSPTKAATPAEQATISVSFLAGVLERSGHSSKLPEVSEKIAEPQLETQTPEKEISKKREKVDRDLLATPPAAKAALFCSPGTSLGLSPDFRVSPVLTSGLSKDAVFSDSQHHDDSHKHATLDTFPGQSIDSYDINNVFHNSSRSLTSRLFGNGVSAKTKSTPVKTELFGDEFEAISALNALSSSPAKSTFSSSTGADNSQLAIKSYAEVEAETQETSKPQKSLFEKVVENSREKRRTPPTSNAKANNARKLIT